VDPTDIPLPPYVRLCPRAWPWSKYATWRGCARSFSSLAAGAPVSTSGSMLVAAIEIVVVVVNVALWAIVMSSSPASYTLVSAISSSLRRLSAHPSATACGPSVILFDPVAAPAAFVVHPAGHLLHFSHVAPVTSIFIVHLLLNTMRFPLQLGHFSCVWPQRAPCCAVHPTTLHLGSLVRCTPEQ